MTPSPHLRITSDTGTEAVVHDPAARTVTLLLEGELDYETTPDLEAAVRDVLATRPDMRELRLDCGRIGFCDTVGLAGLLSIRRGADSAGVTLALDNRTRTLDRLLEISGILRHLTGPLDLESPAGYGGP
jgi:anti-anti-sigma factor